jgi:hypothetical protein
MDTKQFFEEIFNQKPLDDFICIFLLPNSVPHFFKNIDDAAAHVDKLKTRCDQNIYFGTNFLAERPKSGRGKAEDSGGATCFYMDVDFDTESEAHARSDLPKTEADAIGLVKGNGFDPSIIVHSGHGLHVYWLFKEPWIFDSDEEREKCHYLLLRLQETINIKASKSGWSLDSTNDLARVLRVPGTFNIKVPDNPVEVRVIENNLDPNNVTRRYDPSDIEQFLVEEMMIEKTKLSDDIRTQVLGEIILRRDASAPQDKLEQLCEIEENFTQSWKAKRPKFGNDPSRYAQSLANYAAKANWTKQEMCDLLIEFYRNNLNNPLFKNRPGKEPISMFRILRPLKISLTIGKAIQAADEAKAKENGQEMKQADTPGVAETIDLDRARALKYIQRTLRLDVVEIKCLVSEADNPNFYEMLIRKSGEIKSVTFNNAEKMFVQKTFALRVIDDVGISPRSVDKETWGKLKNSFLKAMKNIKVTPSTETIEGKMTVWIGQYLENKPVVDWVRGFVCTMPFVDNGNWYVFAKPFMDWCFQNKGMVEGITHAQINLRRIDAEEVHFDRALPDRLKRHVELRAWKIPHKIAMPPPTMVVDNTPKMKGSESDEDDPSQPDSRSELKSIAS